MARVEPVVGAPAATADLGAERALLVADYHAGIEVALRLDGVEVESRAAERRARLLDLVAETGADRVVFLGDLGHDIGRPTGEEADELEALFEALSVPATLATGNHDGDVADLLPESVTVLPAAGGRLDGVGVAHGHTWPGRDVLTADVVCVGHEHPTVRVADDVGGSRVERAWLRGPLSVDPFRDRFDDPPAVTGELVVFPAFNDLSGGTWVNVEGQTFLSPFLPDALPEADAYLLDGTRLGPYRSV